MLRKAFRSRSILGLPVMLLILVVAAACAAAETPAAEVRIVEKEVIVEVVKEVMVTATPIPPAFKLPPFKTYKWEGAMPTKFNEAPLLATLVQAGKLPPVEERLPVPQDVKVFHPPDEIGQYGGTVRTIFNRSGYSAMMIEAGLDNLVILPVDGGVNEPHMAKSWEVSSDFKDWTFNLRKGIKYSDGTLFTADDYLWGYNEIYGNKEFSASGPRRDYKVGGEAAVLEKVDDYTIKYKFPAPYTYFARQLTTYGGRGSTGYVPGGYAPSHYLAQFHPDFGDKTEIDKMVEDEGWDTWVQLLNNKNKWQNNPEMPVTGPWRATTKGAPIIMRFERNPYYWWVDPAGNQIPYVDSIDAQFVSDYEILNLKALGGQVDFQYRHIDGSKLPLYVANADKSGFRIHFWPAPHGNNGVIFINQTWDGDSEITKLLHNRDFRLALSLAIERDEINEGIFLGTGKPRSSVPAAWTPYYPGPDYETKYAIYDPAEANAILDRIGLDKKDSDGFRLRPDGKRLELRLHSLTKSFLNWPSLAEVIKSHWKAVGIDVMVKVGPRPDDENDMMLHLYVLGNAASDVFLGGVYFAPNRYSYVATRVQEWYTSDGEKGIDPSTQPHLADFAKMIDMFDEGKSTTHEKRIPIGQEIVRIMTDGVYQIGTVGDDSFFKGILIVNKDLINTTPILAFTGAMRPETFSYRR